MRPTPSHTLINADSHTKGGSLAGSDWLHVAVLLAMLQSAALGGKRHFSVASRLLSQPFPTSYSPALELLLFLYLTLVSQPRWETTAPQLPACPPLTPRCGAAELPEHPAAAAVGRWARYWCAAACP